jgi:hypothetical protein
VAQSLTCGPCWAFAAPDVNADGRDEIAVKVGDSLSRQRVELFDGRTLSPITVNGGSPLTFEFGGPVKHPATATCSGHALIVTTASAPDERTFAVQMTRYTFGPGGRSVTPHRTTRRIDFHSPEAASLNAGDGGRLCGAVIVAPSGG